MATSTAQDELSAPSRGRTSAVAWSTLMLSVPLLGVASWFGYDAATSSSEWAALGLLVTVAVALPVVPAIVLAAAALRVGEPRRARVLAVTAALLVASVPLFGAWLGLA